MRDYCPPPEPEKGKGFGCWWIVIGYIVFGAAAVFIVGSLITATTLHRLMELLQNRSTEYNGFQLCGVPVITIIAGCIVFGAFFANSYKKRHENERYAVEHPVWVRAMIVWSKLYFCHRDGVVFNPETAETCHPGTVKDLIYKN